MPTLRIGTPAIHETIVRPATVAITDQVIEFLRLKSTIEDIRYVTHSGDVRMPSSAVTERTGDYASFSGTNRAWVEVEEDIFEDGWSIGRPDTLDAQPLFLDRNLGVSLRPFMESTLTTLKIRFTSHNRDTLVQTRNHLSSRIASLEDGIQHTVQFAIGLHHGALLLLNEIWFKRESRAGYGDTFIEYLQKHSASSLRTVSEASGENLSLVFQRTMKRVNGYFVVAPMPTKPSYQESGSIWEWELEYKVNYDVPTQMFLTYPIMVHNQYLEPVYLSHLSKPRDVRDTGTEHSLSQLAAHLTEFGRAEGNNLVQDPYIRIPEFDHFNLEITPRNTATVLLALLSIEEDKSKPLLNLRELGDVFIDKDILSFIETVEHEYLNKPYRSFFLISLYEGDTLMDPETLYCDKDLNIYSSVDLDPRKTYRFRFGMVADIEMVNVADYRRIWAFPKTADKYIRSINDAVRELSDNFQMTTKRKWEPWMIGPLWGAMTGRDRTYADNAYRDPVTGIYKIDDSISQWAKGIDGGGDITLTKGFQVPTNLKPGTNSRNSDIRYVQIDNFIVGRKV